MRNIRILLLIMLIPFAPRLGRYVAVGCATADAIWAEQALSPADAEFRTVTGELTDLHRQPDAPQPGDWQSTVIEPPQTFAQYIGSDPVGTEGARQVLYLQPIGKFTPVQREIVLLSGEFLGLFFAAPIKILPDISADVIPSEARRQHPRSGDEQFLPEWINAAYLKPHLPDDAIACIGLTATDLWPGGNTNFVFGQASLVHRVGVWSIARHGNPDSGANEFVTCLRRAIKTAAHEMGHMYSMKHCVHFDCVMAGSGSLTESDRHPLFLCPECLAKLHWNLNEQKPQDKSGDFSRVRHAAAARFEALAEFCGRHGLYAEEEYYRVAARRILL